MTKRLTEKQKKEIVQSFEFGTDINVLSKEFKCTKLTVIRNLKKNLGELKYKEIIDKNKSLKKKSLNNKKESNDLLNTVLESKISKKNFKDLEITKKNTTVPEFPPSESFFEIAPLDYEIENSSRKEFSSVPISEIEFPKVVYMIVDKKIELEIKYLKDYPEWQFLSKEELNRKTIQIYDDLKIAKRFCNIEQKVIKVPNTNVFKIVAPFLISKGISRIVTSDKLISL